MTKTKRMFPAPIIVCRGCGKETTSMRAHLRKLSCQAKYTKEEYENFKIEAKQRSDMNKKHDPLLKERAKHLRKLKRLKPQENRSNISKTTAIINTNDKLIISKTKDELTKDHKNDDVKEKMNKYTMSNGKIINIISKEYISATKAINNVFTVYT